MSNSLVEESKPSFLDIILKYIPGDNSVVFLFGSMAEEKASKSSDIDIGIFCLQKVEGKLLSDCRAELEEKIKTLRDIDLIDFSNSTDEKFLNIAMKRIDIWYQSGPAARQFDALVKRISNQAT